MNYPTLPHPPVSPLLAKAGPCVKRRWLLAALACGASGLQAQPSTPAPAVAASAPASSPGHHPADNDIVLGQTGPLTGPAGPAFAMFNSGAQLAFNGINNAGGVAGRRIRLMTMDDGLNPRQGAANIKSLVQDVRVTALFSLVGHVSILESAELIKTTGVPVFGATTGDNRSRDRLGRPFFFTSPTYGREAEHTLEHLASILTQRIAVAFMGNPVGQEVRMVIERKARDLGIQILASEAMDLAGRFDATELAGKLVQNEPQAVLVFNTGEPLVRLVAALRKHPVQPRVFLFSLQDPAPLNAALGPNAVGIVISQVMPALASVRHSLGTALRGELMAANKATGGLSAQQMQGFFNARVLIEALKRSAPKLTHERLVAAAESMSRMDIGGIPLNFSATRRTGHEFIELAMVGTGGRMVR